MTSSFNKSVIVNNEIKLEISFLLTSPPADALKHADDR
jgi:hypothetical protein